MKKSTTNKIFLAIISIILVAIILELTFEANAIYPIDGYYGVLVILLFGLAIGGLSVGLKELKTDKKSLFGAIGNSIVILGFIVVVVIVVIEMQEEESNKKVSTKVLNNTATQLIKQGNINEAIEVLDSVISLNPNILAAYHNKAYAYEKLGYDTLALDLYTYVLNEKPDFKNALLNRGIIYGNWNKVELAEKDYRKALEAGMENKILYNNLAQIERDKGNNKIAEELIDKALILDRQFATGLATKSMILNDKENYNAAIRCIDSAINLEQVEPSHLNNKAWILLNAKRYKESIQYAKKALELDSNFIWAFQNLGRAELAKNNRTAAIKNYQEAISIDSNNALTYKLLALVHFDNDTHLKACYYLNKAEEKGYDFNPEFTDFIIKNCKK
ncbi:MAG: tetratricopeptide repeat protein [Arenibacter algicola]|nr:tetratricopeptide repeat protein [Arenibacter algicola]